MAPEHWRVVVDGVAAPWPRSALLPASRPAAVSTPGPIAPRRPTDPAAGPSRRALRALGRLVLARSWLVTLVVGAVVLLLDVRGPDLPAQEFRTWLARTAGPVPFNDQWYGGHSLPGYSVLFPSVAALLGARITGLLAGVVSTWAVPRLVPGRADAARGFLGLAAALSVLSDLVIGRLTFMLGFAVGLLALLAVVRRRPGLALLAAALCSLASPLAGLFLLLAAVSWAPTIGWRRALPLAGGIAGLVVSAVTGGGGGRFPYPATSLLGVLLFTFLGLIFAPAGSALVRRFAILYGVVGLALFVVPNPVGGNVARLGSAVALPIAGYVLVRHRRWISLGLLLIPLLLWQLQPVGTALANGAGDPSHDPAYYSGLDAFLATQNPAQGRLEVPLTREHWETALLAPHFPLARGWERQLDLQYAAVLYKPLTAASYRHWLDANAVGLVALPDVPLDSGGLAEARLLANPPGYLRLVYRDANWTVWRVTDPVQVASGPATLTTLGVASFTLNFTGPGTEVVRIRADNLWGLDDEADDAPTVACLTHTADGWLAVTADSGGLVHARASVGNVVGAHGSQACRSGAAG